MELKLGWKICDYCNIYFPPEGHEHSVGLMMEHIYKLKDKIEWLEAEIAEFGEDEDW